MDSENAAEGAAGGADAPTGGVSGGAGNGASGSGAPGSAAPENGAITLDLVIDREASAPLYLQLAGGIEEAIRSGVLPPGSRLENELALSKRLKLSRPTVRQGIQELVDKGMLVRKRGVGTQVVQAPVNRQVALTSLYDDLRTAGKAPRTEVVEYRIGRPSPEALDRLQLSPGERFGTSSACAAGRARRGHAQPIRSGSRPPRAGRLGPVRLPAQTRHLAHDGSARPCDEDMPSCWTRTGAALLTMERKSFANDGVVEFGYHIISPGTPSSHARRLDAAAGRLPPGSRPPGPPGPTSPGPPGPGI